MPSSGWGKDFTYAADGLCYAIQNNRPFQTALVGESGAIPGVWDYAGLKDGSKPVCPQLICTSTAISLTSLIVLQTRPTYLVNKPYSKWVWISSTQNNLIGGSNT
jgi:hypothetical protein